VFVALNQTKVHVLVYSTAAKVCKHHSLIFWPPTQNHSNLELTGSAISYDLEQLSMSFTCKPF